MTGNAVSGGYYGILVGQSHRSIVSGNTVSNLRERGISLGESGATTVTGNTVTARQWGIRLESNPDSVLTSNTVSALYGMYLISSARSTVKENTVSDGSQGIALVGSENSAVNGNVVLAPYFCQSGVSLFSSGGSVVIGERVGLRRRILHRHFAADHPRLRGLCDNDGIVHRELDRPADRRRRRGVVRIEVGELDRAGVLADG